MKLGDVVTLPARHVLFMRAMALKVRWWVGAFVSRVPNPLLWGLARVGRLANFGHVISGLFYAAERVS
jgi:hypothetical protein